jgi:hypothetical protein
LGRLELDWHKNTGTARLMDSESDALLGEDGQHLVRS